MTRVAIRVPLLRLVLWLCATVSVTAVPLAAQLRPVSVTGRFGIVGASDDYQTNCGHSSLAVGLDVRGPGRVFPVASIEHFIGSGGGDVACLPSLDAASSRVRGGLRLEGTTRAQVGAGAHVVGRVVRLEGAVRGGATLGRPGVVVAGADDTGARLLPQVGADASLVFFRHAVLSMAFDWTRLPTEVVPLAGGVGRTSHAWSRMTSVQVGLRVGGTR